MDHAQPPFISVAGVPHSPTGTEPMAELLLHSLNQMATALPTSSASPPPPSNNRRPSDPSTGLEGAQTRLLEAAYDASQIGVFSKRRPKDALAGAQSAIKNVLKGASAGGLCLVAAPVIGARHSGWLGMGAGFVVGAGAAAALSVAGIYSGAQQLRAGLRNTPEALRERAGERDWNPYYRRWEVFDLSSAERTAAVSDSEWLAGRVQEQEWVLIGQQGDETGTEPRPLPAAEAAAAENERPVADMAYYELLQVSSSASAEDIRHQYFLLARKCHPDRNRNEDACARFQALGEAYQVLADPVQRSAYDQAGEQGVRGSAVLEPQVLFELLFGSTRWLEWVGNPQAAMLAEVLTESSEHPREALAGLLRFKQLSREIGCAVHLAQLVDRLDPCGGSNYQQCELLRETVVDPLLEESTVLGRALMGLLGRVYSEQALQKGGRRAASILAAMRETSDGYATVGAAVGAVVKTVYQGLAVSEAISAADGGEDPAAVAAATKGMHAAMAEAAYAIVVVELEWTVRCAVWNVLHDRSQTEEVLLRRAEVILLLGQAFQEHACSNDEAIQYLKSQIN